MTEDQWTSWKKYPKDCFPHPLPVNIIISSFTFHYGSTYMRKWKQNSACWPNLHSTMVLFIFRKHSVQFSPYCIYIPLWFYLYSRRERNSRSPVPTFTFHYGSTYIIRRYVKSIWSVNLHSTMVLLIYRAVLLSKLICRIYIPLWFYLYLWNLMDSMILTDLHSTMVLLIWRVRWNPNSNYWIYIPLWFYLYYSRSGRSWGCQIIYIPLWFYLYGSRLMYRLNF